VPVLTCDNNVETTVGVTAKETDAVLSAFILSHDKMTKNLSSPPLMP
jgi:hypothetical protein